MKLLLFDIDGTLLTTNGLGRVSVSAALERVFGRAFSFENISFSGKTDPQIFREILVSDAEAGGDVGDLDTALRDAIAAYEEEVHARIGSAQVDALPGAVDTVARLAAEGTPLGLLTGNLEAMAYLKLTPLGLDGHFPFGAFGSDAEDRNGLPAIAAARAQTHHGRAFAPDEVVIIGDTPRDIECGRAFGAVTVAVATGRFGRDALAEHQPDALLDSLAELEAALG